MNQHELGQKIELAISQHRAGQLAEAEQGYRQILRAMPNHPDFLHLLGLVAGQSGRIDEALQLICSAIAINPQNAAYHFNCGLFLEKKTLLDQAIQSYQRAVELQADYLEALIHLGNAWREKKQTERAFECYAKAAAMHPASAEAQISLGNIHLDRNEPELGAIHFQRALDLSANHPQALSGVAMALTEKGKQVVDLAESMALFGQAISQDPSNHWAHFHLAKAQYRNQDLDESIDSYERAIALLEELPQAKPDLAAAIYNLGVAFSDRGEVPRAIDCFRRATTIKPDFLAAADCLVYSMPFDPAFDSQAIVQESRKWNGCFASELGNGVQRGLHQADRDPNRRLRLGYVSPDFRRHVAGLFILPLLQSHNRESVEIFCYANVSSPDEMTAMMQSASDHWRDIHGISDERAADIIRQDQIDILVDLTLHMAGNRLLVFARRPAPVQVTWLGYPGTTGLAAMDYRLTDPYLDPPGMDESCYSERSIRLAETFWCFDPQDEATTVSQSPAEAIGKVTFGCLNTIWKINDGVLDLWASVLREVAHSRMLILSPRGATQQRIIDRLEAQSIDRHRIEFVERLPRMQYLRLYNRIDICLDTIPYNGHTTSLDAMWMGVPVVTLVGSNIAGRAGLSQLSNLGLHDLIAYSPEEYVRIAKRLANDSSRLIQLRSTLRERMRSSPLMDTARFARSIESAYRAMWEDWCSSQT